MMTVLIPARNEKYLQQTVTDILSKSEARVIVALDGYMTELEPHERLKVVHFEKSIGQRAATNRIAEMVDTEYLMKCDAHCSFSRNFDKEMLALMEPNYLMAPVMCKLNAEKWDIVDKPRCVCYRFNRDLIFDYWHEYEERDDNWLTNTLALQGSCWLSSKKMYFDLNLCDEEFGSWGQQGVEIALKTWLSGGRVVTNRHCFYGHLFRGLEEFPYERDMNQVEHAKNYCKELFLNDAWPKAKMKLKDVLDKFAPVPEWHDVVK